MSLQNEGFGGRDQIRLWKVVMLWCSVELHHSPQAYICSLWVFLDPAPFLVALVVAVARTAFSLLRLVHQLQPFQEQDLYHLY